MSITEELVKLAEALSPAKTPPQRLLSTKEAARYLGTSQETIRNLFALGKLPVVRLDRRMRFDVRDLDGLVGDSKVI